MSGINKLNEKLQSSFDKNLDRALVSGNYGFNQTSGKWDYINSDGNGAMNVNIHGGSTGSGDLKARTNISDASTSTFLKCNTDGTLEMTAELSTAGLATSAKQDTVINSAVRDINNTASIGDGSSQFTALSMGYDQDGGKGRALRVDGNGRLSVVGNSGFGKVTSGSGIGATPEGVLSVGKDSSNNAQAVKVNSAGELLVNFGSGTSQNVNCLGNEEGDGSGTARHIHVDGSGNVLVKEVGTVNTAPADTVNSGTQNDPANSMAVGLRGRQTITDASTETFLLCDSQGHLQCDILNQNQSAQLEGFTDISDVSSVKRVLVDSDGHLQVDVLSGGGGSTKTTSSHTLYSGGSVTIATNSTVDFLGTSATIGTGTANQLNVSGLEGIEYIIEGSGTSPSLNIHQLVGSSASPLVPNQFLSAFSNEEDFAVSFESSKAQHRGLRIKNTSGSHSFTVNSIVAVYVL